ncbi:DUF488 domain-containing protein [Gulosibacter bifidus]|uniref:DUF488 domain-containing protein n=1 Tax=Gulosibacter bifidus TaxID=272239 RepID=A0ABW5RHQ6_9MICO|nr:DUF488 family protein [Gulosibacter bifidus]
MTTVRVKSVRDEPASTDGYRILVNRLWPRGISRERAAIDTWCKDITPSTELRKDYHAERIDFEVFRERYLDEITENAAAAAEFRALVAEQGTVTLVYDSKLENNHATVLREWLANE